ncbi:MAG: hypothetical protein KBC02_01235 [Candidatus Pacebacteria bacterium]|nr:hypothetical protein [Candidatus Paceibacterota bacterium]
MWAEKYVHSVMSRKGRLERRALWIPDAQIVIQWVPLGKAPQVTTCKVFPPPDQKARYRLVESGTVPFAFVEQARRNLKLTSVNQSQMKALAIAVDRIRNRASMLDAVMSKELERLKL